MNPGPTGPGSVTGVVVAGTGGLFSQPMPWTRDISRAAVSPRSSAIIAKLVEYGGWGGTGSAFHPKFQTDISIDIWRDDNATPTTMAPKDDAWATPQGVDAEFWRPDCEDIQFPVPAAGALEGEDGYACTTDGDCHLLVVKGRKLYELWRGDKQGSTFYTGCMVTWDLDHAYDDTLRGLGCTSADAGGFPIAAMLATPDEAFTGDIKHALRFILPNKMIRANVFVAPGTHSTGSTKGGLDHPPYGVRLRLKDGFNEASISGAGGKAIVRALKKYGMFLADGGNIPLTVANDRNTTHTWDELGFDSHTLDSLTVDNFEVVEMGPTMDWHDYDCPR